ncbi:hypothetical protein JOD43_000741 [Pullulanibacillus pueri]|uniref:DUF3899 domain-containing protein n=1 Tax=Pullulanibacillus pueri TaxID=1437324 RepID=A0A8J3ENQ6_9BACL|nr:DUF3899 domain-containing protein [Pullulanibacillus pueri]MBM7680579.1 hypothetical protein [Pullulanibacillus pueri]GGH88734.1 hypothetical protein GCM10007096_41740 [Pullulanibacillus pueri]
MNSFIKKIIGLFGVAILFSLLYLFIEHHQHFLFRLLNGLSLIGIAYIIIGCAFLVFFGGFFRGTAHSIKKFFRSKSDDFADQLWESSEASTLKKKTEDLPNLHEGASEQQKEWTSSFILVGAVFFIVSLILSYTYY